MKFVRKAIGALMLATILAVILVAGISFAGLELFLIILGAAVLVCIFGLGSLILIFGK